MPNRCSETDQYKNKYRVSPARLPGWDYGANALYYITICTENRERYFGEIISDIDHDTQNIGFLRKTVIGDIAHNNWLDIPNHFSFVELDEFVIMPNHVHGILYINNPDKTGWQINKFGVQSQIWPP